MGIRLTLWSLLKEPKFISAMMATAYSIALAMGIVSVVFTPGDLHTPSGLFLSYLMGGFFIVGGVFGLISLHGGEWWLERACIYLLLGALVSYVFSVLYFDADLSEKTLRCLHALMTTALFMTRFYKIRGLVLDPTK